MTSTSSSVLYDLQRSIECCTRQSPWSTWTISLLISLTRLGTIHFPDLSCNKTKKLAILMVVFLIVALSFRRLTADWRRSFAVRFFQLRFYSVWSFHSLPLLDIFMRANGQFQNDPERKESGSRTHKTGCVVAHLDSEL